tara:strand:+ start:464 stop:757 length:294 start_codon:yes stop_codon:yes gene_type:complete
MNLSSKILVFRFSDNVSDLQITSEVKHFIADLSDVNLEVVNKVKEKFINFDKSLSNKDSSFVVVSEFSFDDDLNIVPTLQEAYDFIEMEEMERELNN